MGENNRVGRQHTHELPRIGEIAHAIHFLSLFLHNWKLPQCTGGWKVLGKTVNDPSAGSPTETLLRLLLPLNDQV